MDTSPSTRPFKAVRAKVACPKRTISCYGGSGRCRGVTNGDSNTSKESEEAWRHEVMSGIAVHFLVVPLAGEVVEVLWRYGFHVGVPFNYEKHDSIWMRVNDSGWDD